MANECHLSPSTSLHAAWCIVPTDICMLHVMHNNALRQREHKGIMQSLCMTNSKIASNSPMTENCMNNTLQTHALHAGKLRKIIACDWMLILLFRFPRETRSLRKVCTGQGLMLALCRGLAWGMQPYRPESTRSSTAG